MIVKIGGGLLALLLFSVFQAAMAGQLVATAEDGEEIELPAIEIEGESYLYDFFGQARTRHPGLGSGLG